MCIYLSSWSIWIATKLAIELYSILGLGLRSSSTSACQCNIYKQDITIFFFVITLRFIGGMGPWWDIIILKRWWLPNFFILIGVSHFIFLCHHMFLFFNFFLSLWCIVNWISCLLQTQINTNFLYKIFVPLFKSCTEGSEKEKMFVIVGSPSSFHTFK
jgi:hypothetical protein